VERVLDTDLPLQVSPDQDSPSTVITRSEASRLVGPSRLERRLVGVCRDVQIDRAFTVRSEATCDRALHHRHLTDSSSDAAGSGVVPDVR